MEVQRLPSLRLHSALQQNLAMPKNWELTEPWLVSKFKLLCNFWKYLGNINTKIQVATDQISFAQTVSWVNRVYTLSKVHSFYLLYFYSFKFCILYTCYFMLFHLIKDIWYSWLNGTYYSRWPGLIGMNLNWGASSCIQTVHSLQRLLTPLPKQDLRKNAIIRSKSLFASGLISDVKINSPDPVMGSKHLRINIW